MIDQLEHASDCLRTARLHLNRGELDKAREQLNEAIAINADVLEDMD